jgi:hypothetical protein
MRPRWGPSTLPDGARSCVHCETEVTNVKLREHLTTARPSNRTWSDECRSSTEPDHPGWFHSSEWVMRGTVRQGEAPKPEILAVAHCGRQHAERYSGSSRERGATGDDRRAGIAAQRRWRGTARHRRHACDQRRLRARS